MDVTRVARPLALAPWRGVPDLVFFLPGPNLPASGGGGACVPGASTWSWSLTVDYGPVRSCPGPGGV